MKAIKFLSAATVGTIYNKDEIAGFEDSVADDLIAQGAAEEYKPSKKAAAAAAAVAAEEGAAA
jgi:hypothetical protein